MSNPRPCFLLAPLALIAPIALTALAACASTEGNEQSVPFTMEAPQVTASKSDRAALGQLAPNFSLPDQDGNIVSLEDFRGYPVVLEWFNPDCLATHDAHVNGPIERIAQDCSTSGVQFLAINSGARGMPGSNVHENTEAMELWDMPYPVLFDTTGDVGLAYQARRTPQMFVIDEEGILIYRGAIDNAPGGVVRKGEGVYRNYVDEALAAIEEGREVEYWKTRPYGCPVQYEDD
jgi:peroxiredoxin